MSDILVFDGDDTLYDAEETSKEFFRMAVGYFSNLLQKSENEIISIAKRLRRKHRTRSLLVAFTKEFKLDINEVIVHTDLLVDLERCGVPTRDLERLQVLGRIGSPKLIFTNSSGAFVRSVIERLGLLGCFDDIIGVERRPEYSTKPNLKAYQWLDGLICGKFPAVSRIIFCDNSLDNLRPAHRLGWQTIWFRPRGRRQPAPAYVDRAVRNFSELLAFYEGVA